MDEDEDRTLASVLAFVDAFDADEGEYEPVEAAVELSSGLSSSSSDSQTFKRPSKAKGRAPKYTTLVQRQKRAEISDLREQMRVLEARLSKMQHKTIGNLGREESNNAEGKRKWMELEEDAADELLARRRAELMNRKLRGRLERMARLRKEIERAVDKYQRLEGPMDDGKSLLTAASSAPIGAMTSGLPPVSSHTCAVVPMMLEQLVKQADSVFGRSFVRPQVCWLETNAFEIETEIQSSTTSASSVADAAELLWRRPKEKQLCSAIWRDEIYTTDGSHSFLRSLLPIRCRPWGSNLRPALCIDRAANGSSVEVLLHVEHYSRRFYDKLTGRAVLVMLAHVRLSGDDGEVLLRERFWKCITPINKSGSGSSNGGSVTQTSYRIEPGDGNATQLRPEQASVMHALVQMTRRNQAMYQEWLLDEC